jgi:hypothetical protein
MFKDLIGGSTATFPTASNPSANQAHYPLDATEFSVFQSSVLLEELSHLVTSTGQSLTNSSSASAHRQVRTAVETIARQQVAKYAHFADQKASGTGGGNNTSGAWETRVLNTSLINGISGSSLASNQVTLPAGTYFVQATAPANDTALHRMRLRNITASTTLCLGSTVTSPAGGGSDTNAQLAGKFTLASTSVLELQHFFTAVGTDGLGFPLTASGEPEIYAQLMIWQLS